ncbi:1107_t:CDS:1, partial [Racocetra fulgida]
KKNIMQEITYKEKKNNKKEKKTIYEKYTLCENNTIDRVQTIHLSLFET